MGDGTLSTETSAPSATYNELIALKREISMLKMRSSNRTHDLPPVKKQREWYPCTDPRLLPIAVVTGELQQHRNALIDLKDVASVTQVQQATKRRRKHGTV